jgi:hypothetical protein
MGGTGMRDMAVTIGTPPSPVAAGMPQTHVAYPVPRGVRRGTRQAAWATRGVGVCHWLYGMPYACS